MADKSGVPSSSIHVEIFGQTYTVKAGSEPGYVEEADGLVRELSAVLGE